jgi:hypothetical protein
VAAEAVRQRLDEDGAALVAGDRQGLARHAIGVGDVHPVAAHSRDAEALALAQQVGHRGVALERRPHPEAVVRDHEDDGQAPQRGEVHRLAEGALVGGAVAELAERRVLRAEVVGGQSEARGDREVAADDPVAAHEALLEIEHVHRPAAALAEPVDAPEELGHDAIGIAAARERVAVRAVRRDEVVLIAQRARGADDRRLLADREMQEAADLRLRVHLTRALLEAADEDHRRQPLTRDVRLGKRGVLGGVRDWLCHQPRSLPAEVGTTMHRVTV